MAGAHLSRTAALALPTPLHYSAMDPGHNGSLRPGGGRKRRGLDTDTNPHSIRGLVSTRDMGAGLKRGPDPANDKPKWHHSTATDDELTLDKLSGLIFGIIPDAPLDVLYGATEAVAEICTASDKDTQQKLEETQKLLGEPVEEVLFGDILRLSQQLGDEWGAGDEVEAEGEVVFAVDDDDDAEAESEEEADVPSERDDETTDATQFVSKTTVTTANDDTPTNSLTLKMSDITPVMVSQLIQGCFSTTEEAQPVVDAVTELFKREENASDDFDAEFEDELLEAFSYDHVDVIKQLVHNRKRIYWKLRYLDDNEATKEALGESLDILREILGNDQSDHPQPKRRKRDTTNTLNQPETAPLGPQEVDITQYCVHDDTHKPLVKLPLGTYQEAHHDYDIITVPPPPTPEAQEKPLVQIADLPEYCQPAFGNTTQLNRIQLAVFADAFESDANMLICAPTGAGKTNIAMLTLLRVWGKHLSGPKLARKRFKAVYIAPLRALVQEQVRAFQLRLPELTVVELTGDSDTTAREIAEANVLVVTPEKWDVITRKLPHYVSEVELLVIDEIHLLHDDRGPVLESLVVRTRRDPRVRIVGLSATLPNYGDVATFIGAQLVHFFDGSFRPCPLEQQFYGIKARGMKRVAAMNNVVESVCRSNLEQGNQVIVFVHLRKETGKLAKVLGETLNVVDSESVQRELNQAAADYHNQALKQATMLGVGCHHAGLSRDERLTTERLFLEGRLRVLVLTATLAWGVNLPAHTVIIRGTEQYLPADGRWRQLSPQDVLQMLGRAGRPGFDTLGLGIVITGRDWLQYYLAVTNQQLPIESTLPLRLNLMLNAEVVAGTVSSFDQALQWLNQTYYAVRVRQSPLTYGITDVDATLTSIVHLVLKRLHDGKLLVYDDHDVVKMTELGKIALFFYLNPTTIAGYLDRMRSYHSEVDVLLVFCHSDEFAEVPVRPEERYETRKLWERCPIPIKEGADTGVAKINVLLQSYVARLPLTGFALHADMVYVSQLGLRLFAALAQLCLLQGWSQLAQICLRWSLMVKHRVWAVDSPFAQLAETSPEVIRATLAARLPFGNYFHQQQLDQFSPPIRDQLTKLVKLFPQLTIDATVHPLAPLVVRCQLDLVLTLPHRYTVMVCVDDRILWSESVRVESSAYFDLFLPLVTPVPQVYEVIAVLSQWLHVGARFPAITSGLIVPKSFASASPVDDDQPEIPLLKFGSPDWGTTTSLNKYQSQAFHLVWHTENNVYVGMALSNQPTVLAKLAVLAWLNSENADGKVLWLTPNPTNKIDLGVEGVSVGIINGVDAKQDLATIAQSHVVVLLPLLWEQLLRRWRQRKLLHSFDVMVCDHIHALRNSWEYEVAIARMRTVATSVERPLRIVACGDYTGNGASIGEWLGCSKLDIYNFSGSARAEPCAIELVADDGNKTVAKGDVVYCELRSQCLAVCHLVDDTKWSHKEIAALVKAKDPQVAAQLARGIGVLYLGMDADLERVVRKLWAKKALDNVISTADYVVDATATVIWSTSLPLTKTLELVALTTHRAVVYVPANQIEQYRRFLLYETPLPVESGIGDHIDDVLMAEVVSGTVGLMQQALDWLTHTYFYRRMQLNPSFYGVSEVSYDGISLFLSELVELLVERLTTSQLVEVEDADDEEEALVATTEAAIALRYGVLAATMALWTASATKLTERSRLKGVLWALAHATELDVPVSNPLELAKLAPITVDHPETAPAAFWLLQAYFSRQFVGFDRLGALSTVKQRVLPLVNAIVDLLLSRGYLNALVAMDISQMVVQQLWKLELPLVQLPHVLPQLLERAKQHNVTTVFDILALEDDERDAVLLMDESQQEDVAEFVNAFPNVDLAVLVSQSEVKADDPVELTVMLERDEETDGLVVCPFTKDKHEVWWIVVGDFDLKQLYGIRRTTITQESQKLLMEVLVPSTGNHGLSVWAICDSYADADKEVAFDLSVV